MKRYIALLFLLVCSILGVSAQKKSFSYKFYGRVRGDLFYNSRANAETVDGLFYLYPKDHSYDAVGKDLNATPQGSFYLLYTRMGLDLEGPKIGNAKATAKIETDFRGSGSSFALLRIRHAYVNLAWEHSSLLLGQTWHPLFGDVSPSMLNLSTGAPFQPFNRSPMLRYRYTSKGWQWTAATIWQLQYTSAGPNGKSEEYLKNGCLPEIYLGMDHKGKQCLAGVGVELLSLKPRLQHKVGEHIYKVNERVTSLSVEAHLKYVADGWTVAAKSLLANNLTQASMLGGYAVTAVDAQTGEQTYSPFRHSMTWLNVVYGKKWQPGFFVGYLKNLGTGKDIAGSQYGVGLDVGQLLTTNWQISYNLPHWKLGVEYAPSTAWYGDADARGRIHATHAVTNHRILGVLIYMF